MWSQTKNVCVYLGQHGDFLWFQSSPRESLDSSGICLFERAIAECACDMFSNQ